MSVLVWDKSEERKFEMGVSKGVLYVKKNDGTDTYENGVASANKRNDLLYDALTSNYDKFIKSINDAGIETTAFQDRVKAAINENGGDADTLVQKYGSLEKAIRAGAVSSDLLKKSLGGVANLNIDRLLHLKDTGDDVKSVQEALSQLGYDLSKYGADGILGSSTIAAIKAFQEAKGLSTDGIVGPNTVKALQDAVGSTDKLKSNVNDLMNDITKKGGRDLAMAIRLLELFLQ